MNLLRNLNCVSIEVVDNALAVRIPPDIKVDRSAARKINHAYFDKLHQTDVKAALADIGEGTILTEAALERVDRAAAGGYNLGIEKWAVVSTDPTTRARFSSAIPEIDTRQFNTRADALDWIQQTDQPQALARPHE